MEKEIILPSLYKEAKEYMEHFSYRIAYVPFEISKEDYIEKVT